MLEEVWNEFHFLLICLASERFHARYVTNDYSTNPSMTELNFLWEFTSEWASEILESSKLKYTEQSSHWAVDNCQSRKPVGTKCKLDLIWFYFGKVIYNDEVVKFYSPFPNKNNKEGSRENCCCELFSLLQMKTGVCVLETLEGLCKHWALLQACFVLLDEKVEEGSHLPVKGGNIHNSVRTGGQGRPWWCSLCQGHFWPMRGRIF